MRGVKSYLLFLVDPVVGTALQLESSRFHEKPSQLPNYNKSTTMILQFSKKKMTKVIPTYFPSLAVFRVSSSMSDPIFPILPHPSLIAVATESEHKQLFLSSLLLCL
ncbi:hypothetical protein DET59_104219 [Rossellomorea aquimaris]|uniref:Uncharacterized protein n=1 Tax=Rossellomorea aquimaris TaxID=189382 RepID=A0A366EUX0_9BACI|nr:hypothetical protein DET59_104219 [Rossellomorea aquimaris]